MSNDHNIYTSTLFNLMALSYCHIRFRKLICIFPFHDLNDSFFFFLIYFRMIIRRLISEDSSPFLSSFFMVLMMGLSWEVDLLSDTWTRRERGRLPKEATMKNDDDDDDDDEVSCITKYFFMLKSKKANTRSSWVAKTLDFLLDLPVTCWGGRTAFALE